MYSLIFHPKLVKKENITLYSFNFQENILICNTLLITNKWKSIFHLHLCYITYGVFIKRKIIFINTLTFEKWLFEFFNWPSLFFQITLGSGRPSAVQSRVVVPPTGTNWSPGSTRHLGGAARNHLPFIHADIVSLLYCI